MDNNGNPIGLITVTIQPHLLAQKVTTSGKVLLALDQTGPSIPSGYVWSNGVFTPLNQNLGNSAIFDMNDSGVVVGEYGISVPNPEVLIQSGEPAQGAFEQPIYWSGASGNASPLGLPAGTAEASSYNGTVLFSASQVSATIVSDNGAAYGWSVMGRAENASPGSFGSFLNVGQLSVLSWNSGAYGGTPTVICPVGKKPFTFTDGTLIQISPNGAHLITEISDAVSEGKTGGGVFLDGTLIPRATILSGLLAINNSGRILSDNGYTDLLGAPVAIPGLQEPTAINSNNDILSQPGSTSSILYTWTPPLVNRPAPILQIRSRLRRRPDGM